MEQHKIFPFVAVVGQEQVKKALLIAIVNPKAGGVLITGEKGVAKSTLVRGLGQVIPTMEVVELPLNATEDMVFGSLDIQQAIVTGKKVFSQGLLGRAHKQVLYMDEVNLLNKELMNAILDTAVSGIQIVEREGISQRQEACFSMIGTMNPEEGELSPQLLDRFGLCVGVCGEQEIVSRVEVMKRILAYDRQPTSFCAQYKEAEQDLCQQVLQGKEKIQQIKIPESMMELAAQMCAQVYCAGHRGEIFLLEAGKAIAALAGRNYMLPQDMEEAAGFVLPHRMRQQPQNNQEQPHSQEEGEEEQAQDESPADNNESPKPEQQEEEQPQSPTREANEEENSQADSQDTTEDQQAEEDSKEKENGQEQIFGMDEIMSLGKMVIAANTRKVRAGSGKRKLTKTDSKQGRYVRARIPSGPVTDIAFDATVRAAAPYQRTREKGECCLRICQEDLRQKVREKSIGSTFLFVVDASGSMGARERMKAVKGAILALLEDAYQKRDKVGMIAFRRQTAEVLLPITRSVDLAQKCLESLPTGGKTPLGEGLRVALDMLGKIYRVDKDAEPVLVLVTDGRVNGGKDAVQEAITAAEGISGRRVHSLVIDTEQDFVKIGIAPKIAQILGGAYYKLEELTADTIIKIVNTVR